MKVAIIFVLLFATVICRPARKVSSSDSSEEVVRRPALRKQALVASKSQVTPAQKVVGAPVDKSLETSGEEAVVPQAAGEVKAGMSDMVAPTETPTVDSDEDKNDDDDQTEEDETEEEDEMTDESESEEFSTHSPSTVSTVVVTEEPFVETTVDTILPTIITDPDSGRGDNIGGYPSDYKSTVYVEEKSYHKRPAPYKSYGYVDSGKKTAYDNSQGNEVEKSPKVYKAFQIQTDFVEEDTSTPEVETQGLDLSSSIAKDQDMHHRQTNPPEEEETAGTSDTIANESGSSSTTQEEEEEEEESASSDIASASQESEKEESESSEEATATLRAADSDSDEEDSDESDSDEEGAGPVVTTASPLVITAK